MKKNFDTSALRKTAADIQGAVVPKSVTADMVGGLFSALVEAQGEVIEALGALEREVVTVKVNGYDGEQRVSAAGAKVYVDIFSIGSVPTVALPRQELTANEEGIVTFEVFKGYQYAVFSKLEGYGASFQFSYEACQDARDIELWNMPTGVYMCGYVGYYNEEDESTRGVPFVTESFETEYYDSPATMWDAKDGETVDEAGYVGILVATEDTSFIIEPQTRSSEYLTWAGNSYYGKLVPTLPAFFLIANGDWEAAQKLARNDFDGNLNTAKIQAYCRSAKAAEYCTDEQANNLAQRFLPSAGQLYLMYLNKTAINRLVNAANGEGWEFDVIDDNYYWSSSQFDEFCAWLVNMLSGGTASSAKLASYYVRAVSAFHFIY